MAPSSIDLMNKSDEEEVLSDENSIGEGIDQNSINSRILATSKESNNSFV